MADPLFEVVTGLAISTVPLGPLAVPFEFAVSEPEPDTRVVHVRFCDPHATVITAPPAELISEFLMRDGITTVACGCIRNSYASRAWVDWARYADIARSAMERVLRTETSLRDWAIAYSEANVLVTTAETDPSVGALADHTAPLRAEALARYRTPFAAGAADLRVDACSSFWWNPGFTENFIESGIELVSGGPKAIVLYDGSRTTAERYSTSEPNEHSVLGQEATLAALVAQGDVRSVLADTLRLWEPTGDGPLRALTNAFRAAVMLAGTSHG